MLCVEQRKTPSIVADVTGSSNDGPGTLSNSRHVKKQDGVTSNHEKKTTTETESQIVQLLPVVDKEFKITH